MAERERSVENMEELDGTVKGIIIDEEYLGYI